MFDLLIVGCLVILLGYASRYDYKNRAVEMWVVSMVIVLGCLYFLASGGNIVETLAVMFFTVIIWGLPVFFGFGLGDFLLMVGLSFFVYDVSELITFYGVLLVVWLFVSVFLIIRDKKKIDKKFFYYHEYPLIPVITISFIIWFIGRMLLW